MAIDTHIKFDGIEGESAHVDHKGEFEVLSWSWGLTAFTTAAGRGSARGRAKPQELAFTHIYDKASPKLARSAARGEHIKTAVLTARKAGEGQSHSMECVGHIVCGHPIADCVNNRLPLTNCRKNIY